jgi:putative hydrolase of the HAD superfamily
MIKHLLFDIDDTLFPSTEFAELARKNALRAMVEVGINIELHELERTLEKVIKEKNSNYPKHFDEVCRIHKIKKPARYIAAAVAAYHNTKMSILPYPEIPRMLLTLRENGYKLYTATNGNAIKQWDKLIRLGIALYFEDVFVSDEVGEEKSVIFFKDVLKKLKAIPEECVMIGDREDSDIIPAKKIGMYAIRVRRGKYAKGKTCADANVRDFSNILEIIKSLENK